MNTKLHVLNYMRKYFLQNTGDYPRLHATILWCSYAHRVMRWGLAGLLPIALSLSLVACGGNAEIPREPGGGSNSMGGNRSNNYSMYPSTTVSSFSAAEYAGIGEGFIGPPVAVGNTRIAVVAEGGSITLLQGDSVIWRYQFPDGVHPLPELSADSSGTIFATTTDCRLYAIASTGALLWDVDVLPDTTLRPVLLPTYPLVWGSNVIVGNSQGDILAMDGTGKELWRNRRGAGVVQSLAAATGVGIVAGISFNSYTESDTVLALDANGRQKWVCPLPGKRIQFGPVIVNGNVLVGVARRLDGGNRAPELVAISVSGSVLWQKELPVMVRGISGDNEGNIYVTGSGAGTTFSGGALLSFDSIGAKRWEALFESGVPAPAAISAEWVYCITRYDGRTGLYTYSREGVFATFVSIDALPDVHARPVVLPSGNVILAGLDSPVLLRGNNAKILGLF